MREQERLRNGSQKTTFHCRMVRIKRWDYKSEIELKGYGYQNAWSAHLIYTHVISTKTHAVRREGH